MIVVMLIGFVVNVLLLFAADRFLGTGENFLRVLFGAFVNTVFTVLSMVPGFTFLAHTLWRLCGLCLTALLAFGFRRSTILKLLLFSLLHLSLGELTGSKNEITAMLLGAAGIGFACLIAGKQKRYIPVELNYREQTVCITALRDTGNTLRDPVTGKSVLVVGADIAERLTGLSSAALRDPVRTMGAVPGLRLIPYQTVGNAGFLLAVSVADAKIGNRQGSVLVALSPNLFGSHYQALTGGWA